MRVAGQYSWRSLRGCHHTLHDSVDRKTDAFNAYMQKCGLAACVTSVSGGVDSAVTLALCMAAKNKAGSPVQRVIGEGGRVWVADSINNRVQVFNKAGAYVRTIGGNGQGNGNNQFDRPVGAAIEPGEGGRPHPRSSASNAQGQSVEDRHSEHVGFVGNIVPIGTKLGDASRHRRLCNRGRRSRASRPQPLPKGLGVGRHSGTASSDSQPRACRRGAVLRIRRPVVDRPHVRLQARQDHRQLHDHLHSEEEQPFMYLDRCWKGH